MTTVTDGVSTIVVIGFAEALSAPEVVWSLVDAGYTVVAFARQGMPAAVSHSRYTSVHRIPAPEIDAEASITALVNLLGRLRASGSFERHAVLPLDDSALWLCSRAAPEAGWVLAGPADAGRVELALDKQRQTETAMVAGLTVPETTIAQVSADLDRLPFPFPLILRPATATRLVGRRLFKGRNWICSDERELAAARAAWRESGPLLVQPYMRGVGGGAFGIATDSGVVGWSGHRRLRMMNPHGSGSSACVSVDVDDSLKRPIAKFLESVAWRGMFMIELLHTAGGTYFVEFNGRSWGSMALARRQGFEYPAWSVRLAFGEPVEIPARLSTRAGLVCRNVGRELMHLLFVLRGARSNAIESWPSFWSALRDVLGGADDGAIYNWRRDDWRVFVSDSYYTVLRNIAKSKEV